MWWGKKDVVDTKNNDISIYNAAFHRAVYTQVPYIEFSPDGYILDVNDHLLRMFGYEKQEVIGKHHKELCFPEDVITAEYKKLWSELRQGKSQRGRFIRKSKSNKAVWRLCCVIRSENQTACN